MERYSAYRQSGIEWVGKIPEHWEERRFVFLFSFSRGLPISKQDLKDIGVPCLNYGEIHSKFGFEVNPEINSLKCVDEDYLSISNNSLLRKGDIVFADTSEDIEGAGNFTCLEGDIPTFAGYHTIVAKQKKNEHYRFLAYYFESVEYRTQIRSQVRGIKVFSITQEILKSTKVLLPPLPEQEAIASFLDRKTMLIDDLIAKKERLFELKKEERTAIINQAVTKGLDPNVPMKDSGIEWLGEIPEHWEMKKLKYTALIKYGLGQPPKSLEGGLPIIRATNIKSGTISEVDLLFVDPDDIPYERDPILELNDIIVVRSGAYTADSAIIPAKYVGSVTGYDMVVKAETINPNFLAYGFLSNYILYNQLFPLKLRAAQPHLNAEELGETLVLTPPENEQKTIAQNLMKITEALDVKISRIKEQIDLLREYKTTLISEAVTGKIKVM